MGRKQQQEENYLERIPMQPEGLGWSADAEGMVTLEVENKGIMNRIAQKLLKKPKISYIHLDEIGSFVWPLIDGQRSIMDMGEPLEAHFGEKAKPTYDRLAQFFRILESYGFVQWKNG
ncbi:MAG: PqqD family peptide modification chaperone [Oscillospiraceae bacterium]|nr:PqqD family peptide modification chaperone [Oscillospiraceae bacterium]